MRRVIGKTTVDLDAAQFAALRARHPGGLVLDLGTGDGKHAITEAHRRPDTLVLGLDASPDAMRRAAARAAAKKNPVPNALFVWASIERLPPELADVTEVHALMPWGSLLRALVTPDEAVLSSVAACCVPDSPFLVTLNLRAWRPPVPEVGGTPEPTPEAALAGLAASYARAGWRLAAAEYLDEARIAELATSWTKRLGASRPALDVLALRGSIA